MKYCSNGASRRKKIIHGLYLVMFLILATDLSSSEPSSVWVDPTWKDQEDVSRFDPNLVFGVDAFNSLPDGIYYVSSGGSVKVILGEEDSISPKKIMVEFLAPGYVMPGYAPITGAFVGDDYNVIIDPLAMPCIPINRKPAFGQFSIESANTDIDTVYYQVDGYLGNWNVIQSGINAKTWYWPGWAISDAEWADLLEGTHTYYFKFTRTGGGSSAGDIGEISWQFFKSSRESLLNVIFPNGGEILTREPYTIMWDLPTTANIESITISYSRDGGRTYPYLIAELGPDASSLTSYMWRSPNVRTSQGKIRVTARYTNGAEYSDTTDGVFSITKGYSVLSWRPWEDISFKLWE